MQHDKYTTAQSATLGLHPVARKLLLISRPAEGRRLSWPEHTVDQQLVHGCLQMTRFRFKLPLRATYLLTYSKTGLQQSCRSPVLCDIDFCQLHVHFLFRQICISVDQLTLEYRIYNIPLRSYVPRTSLPPPRYVVSSHCLQDYSNFVVDFFSLKFSEKVLYVME